MKNQITKLELSNLDHEWKSGPWDRYSQIVYAHILSHCQKLERFEVLRKTVYAYPPLSIHRLPTNTFSSSTLTHLSIYVGTFTDCLCLLDGRLKQLNTFIVQVYTMKTDLSLVHNLVCNFQSLNN